MVEVCEQIRVVDRRRIIGVMGHLDAPTMDEVGKALRAILGL